MGPVTSTPRGGALFGRYLRALIIAKGDVWAAAAFADGQGPGWREVSMALKGAVTPMDAATQSAGLAYPIAMDFAEALRPATIIGRLVGVRRVPFNTRLMSVAVGASAAWIGENVPIPAGALDLDGGTTLPFAKLASLSVHTTELARSSSPSVEMVLAADAIKAAAYAADFALVSEDNAGIAGGKPASITRSATAVPSSGSAIAQIDTDLRAVIAVLTGALVDLSFGVWLMNPRTATYLATLRGTGGAAAFPGLGPKGGVLLGMPVLTSAAVSDANSPGECPIILLAADELLLADDGDSTIDISEQAAIIMDSAPGAGASAMVSLWAHGLAGVKATRAICWQLRHAAACALITGVQF